MLITFPVFKPVIKTFNDEYDTKSINKYIDQNSVVFIKGIYPGTGKSQAVKNYDKDTLFIVPYNELGLQMMTEGYKTSTFNSFFGLDLTDNERINEVKFDYSKYKTIYFDESYLHIPSRQKKIDKFIKENTELIIIGFDYPNQAEAIGCDDPLQIDNCINIIFKNQI